MDASPASDRQEGNVRSAGDGRGSPLAPTGLHRDGSASPINQEQAGPSQPSSFPSTSETRRHRNIFGISWLPFPDRLGLAPVLENTGSVARDHLALERTFLAWLRTSLGLVSLGIAITQLFKIPELVSTDPEEDLIDDDQPFNGQETPEHQQPLVDTRAARLGNVQRLGKPIGGSFIALGMIVLLLGAFRFFAVQRQLVGGKFSPSRVETSATALLVGAMIIAAFGVVVGMRLGASP